MWGFAERMGAQVKGLHKTALILDTNRKVRGPHLRFRSAGYKFGGHPRLPRLDNALKRLVELRKVRR